MASTPIIDVRDLSALDLLAHLQAKSTEEAAEKASMIIAEFESLYSKVASLEKVRESLHYKVVSLEKARDKSNSKMAELSKQAEYWRFSLARDISYLLCKTRHYKIQ